MASRVVKLKFNEASARPHAHTSREDSPRGWRRSTLQRASGLQPTAALSRHMLESVLAGAANYNPAPSSQDRKGRRGAVQWLGRASSGLGRCRGELLLIDLGTLQAPPAGDSSALTALAARDLLIGMLRRHRLASKTLGIRRHLSLVGHRHIQICCRHCFLNIQTTYSNNQKDT